MSCLVRLKAQVTRVSQDVSEYRRVFFSEEALHLSSPLCHGPFNSVFLADAGIDFMRMCPLIYG